MPTKQTPQRSSSERVQESYKKLTHVAAELNDASDGLKEAMSVLDVALSRLNLGVSAWVQISGNEDEDGDWWTRRLGYAKVGQSWVIALSTARGNYNRPDLDSVEEWSFNDAPRWMRIDAVAKIPDLLEALVKQSQDTTEKLKKRTDQVLELATAMSNVLENSGLADDRESTNA